ncbi:MAG: LD-carboxypeptidase, partial [Nitrospinaceae bacterium]|nr:LD-carboxypeptidase [Nitrospinaceae bacterium]
MVAGNFAQYPMARSKKQLLDLLTKKNAAKTLKFPRARVLNPGRAEGPVTGGCLTLLCRSLKTPFEIQTRDKILILEDVN